MYVLAMLPQIKSKGADPAELGWPPTFAMEVAMKSTPLRQLLEDYGLSREDWEALKTNVDFISDVRHWMEELKKDNGRFRMKAKLQAEELLKTSWKLIHKPDTPAAVKADLIKSTVRWGGLEPTKDGPGSDTPPFNITFVMS